MVLPTVTPLSDPKTAARPVNTSLWAVQGLGLPECDKTETWPFSSLQAETSTVKRKAILATISKVFFMVALLSILSTFVAGSVLNLAYGYWGSSWPERELDSIGWPSPNDRRSQTCSRGASWSFGDGNNLFASEFAPAGAIDQSVLEPFPFRSRTSYDFATSLDLLYLVSHGSFSRGNVNLKASRLERNNIEVDIIVSYRSQEAFDRVNVCLLEQNSSRNTRGVGIFTPSRSNDSTYDEELKFDVTVRFPITTSRYPLAIKGFETDLPDFVHEIDDLDGLVSFGSISLQTSDAPINAGALFAETAVLKTSNASIRGSYNTSSSLRLETSNDQISVDIEMNSANNRATKLLMTTSNAPIFSAIGLYSKSRTTGGAYKVTALTSNEQAEVNFIKQPVESQLRVEVETSVLPAIVSLSPAYEGTFSLRSGFGSSVQEHDVVDPTGEGRNRTVNFKAIIWRRRRGKCAVGPRKKG